MFIKHLYDIQNIIVVGTEQNSFQFIDVFASEEILYHVFHFHGCTSSAIVSREMKPYKIVSDSLPTEK